MRSRCWMLLAGRHARVLLALLLALVVVVQADLALGQIAFGATLTVLRGTTSVVRADGTAVMPASTGLSLNVGDRVATVGRAAALVTFFDGSEVELGADTTISIQDLQGGGGVIRIIVEMVLGSAVHHVATLTDPGSYYKIVAGDTVTLVHGTTVATGHDGDGNSTSYLVNSSGPVTFPNDGHQLHDGEACTATSSGDLLCEMVKGKDPWSVLADGVGAGGNGSSNSSNTPKSDDKNKDNSAPTPTPVSRGGD
ncbi:MAG: hypothetical protein U0893_20075 [Chloroflexota bacterium]